MNCPVCETDLTDKVHHASETGMWQFCLECDCGAHFLWRQSRLRPIRRSDYNPEVVVSA
jgi:hypothetical protein